jgi:diguanylate cyclase (GGDEF)-like protein
VVAGWGSTCACPHPVQGLRAPLPTLNHPEAGSGEVSDTVAGESHRFASVADHVNMFSLLLGATAPRDRASAARTLLFAAVFSLVATAGWEVAAVVAGRSETSPASSVQAVGLASIVVLLAGVCFRAPDRVPRWMYPVIAFVAPCMTVVVALSSNDGSAAGQLGLVYPVIYAAAHFRRPFAWAVAALASLAAAIIAFSTLPKASALADVVVMAPALAMITLVLVTLAEHHERLMLRLADLAAADPLTGLATRRELQSVAERVLQPTVEGRRRGESEQGTALGLMLIDIDHFKVLNDELGHPAGDAVLVHLAEIVRTSVRDTDTVARMGGDELAVLLAGSADEVERRARAVLEAVAHSSIPVLSGAPLTVSIGVANGHVGRTTFQHLYADADQALYEAKAAGRNTVIAKPAPTA